MTELEHIQLAEKRRVLVRKLDAVGWGLFFIWIGIAFLADVGWGVGLFGVGVIVLGAQAARKLFAVPVERFGLVMGIVFVVWGVWEVLDLHFGEASLPAGLVPLLFIVVGIVLVVSALLRERHE